MGENELVGGVVIKKETLVSYIKFFFHSDIGKRKSMIEGTRTFALDCFKIREVVSGHNFFYVFLF